jgi:hypothetical protein
MLSAELYRIQISTGAATLFTISSRQPLRQITVNNIFTTQAWSFWQHNSGKSETALFVPGGSAMQILVPWKPVVLMWGLLSEMILFSFIASSVLQGRDPFAPGAQTIRS